MLNFDYLFGIPVKLSEHGGRDDSMYYKTNKQELIFPPDGLELRMSRENYSKMGYSGLPLLNKNLTLKVGDLVVLVLPGAHVYKCEYFEKPEEEE